MSDYKAVGVFLAPRGVCGAVCTSAWGQLITVEMLRATLPRVDGRSYVSAERQ